MLSFFADNLWTIIICAALLAIFAAVIVSLVKKKKQGKSSCGCGCANCPMSGACHKQ